ncbi:MAG: response regulator [Planctomycetes bacterium]|nr:response regulator [Planctomycetota bacterium]MCA8944641.1 response regulator [Planctomycetota bacterium]
MAQPSSDEVSEVEILLADDDAGHATLIRNNLRDVGLRNTMRHFEDGQQVLDFLNAKPNGVNIDKSNAYMLLLDVHMPKVNGVEVLRHVKADPELRLIPVIMLTTTDDPREIRTCHELGCNEYITKPVGYDQFVEVIRRLGLFLQVVRVSKLTP